MLRRLVLAASVLGMLGIAAPSQAKCLRYEQRVTLAGKVVARRMPGPPGYRNVGRGDYPETVYFLEVEEPFCVIGDRSSRNNKKTHFDVSEVQLTESEDGVRRHRGDDVRVRGSLFGAHMPYHRTPVVLDVETVRPAP